MIPYGQQDISKEDIEAVVEVLNSDFLTQGPKIPIFEKQVADYCDAKFGVAVNSATSALHSACYALELGKGDYLWTSPNSYVASSNCGLYCGAQVDFVDIDPKTYNLSVSKLEKKLVKAKNENKLPKVVVVVHFAGQPCEMEKIHKLSSEYNFSVIEDASHSIGGKYLNHPIGNCQFSDITVFSFHPVKIITTAEGGMATTNSSKLAKRMEIFRTHGVTREKPHMIKKDEGPWYYEQIELGFNYRMTELQAALGISQMKRVDEFVEKRHRIKARYDLLLNDLPLITPYLKDDSYSALHLYPILIELDKVSKSRKEIFNDLRQRDIGVNVHYIPIHTQPYYCNLGFKKEDFPNSLDYYNKVISLPMFHAMTTDQQDEVVKALESSLK